jgi:hypothetical protein
MRISWTHWQSTPCLLCAAVHAVPTVCAKKAFIKLESLKGLTDEQKQNYEDIAMEIFTRLVYHSLCFFTVEIYRCWLPKLTAFRVCMYHMHHKICVRQVRNFHALYIYVLVTHLCSSLVCMKLCTSIINHYRHSPKNAVVNSLECPSCDSTVKEW